MFPREFIIIIIKDIYIAQVRKGHKICRQRWQYGYVTVYVSIVIYITNYQES